MYKPLKKEIISVLVHDQINVLTRVVSHFGKRGFSIESLTSSATKDPDLKRLTIVVSTTEQSMQQIITQTEKLEVVESVHVLNRENSLYRELLLLKVEANAQNRADIKAIVEVFRGKIVDLSSDSMIIELTGTPEKIDGFVDLMEGYNVLEVCRTGITGIEANIMEL